MSDVPNPIRLLVCDDTESVRNLLRMVFSAEAGIELVGEAKSGAEAVEMAGALKPDVVIVDALMPGMDGFETIRQLRRLLPRARLIMWSGLDAPANQEEYALAAGADAYVQKAAQDPCQIIDCVRVPNAPPPVW